jgi:hypothetical protein
MSQWVKCRRCQVLRSVHLQGGHRGCANDHPSSADQGPTESDRCCPLGGSLGRTVPHVSSVSVHQRSEVCGRSLGVRGGSSYPLRLRRQSRCAAVASRWGASSSFSLSHCVLTAYETLRNRALGLSKTQTSRRKEARDGSRDDSDWDRGRLVVIAPPRFSEAPWAAMSLAGALAGQNPFQSPGEPRLLSVRHAVDFGRWCRHTGRQRRYEGSVRAHRWRS